MKQLSWIAVMMTLALCACKKDARQPDLSYNPVLLPADFTQSVNLTNPYFPFEAGKTYIYEGQTGDGLERVEVQRLPATKTILGINCLVVNDKVFLNGKLVEDTDDWYAQDNSGAVWYLGEAVDNYNADGTLKDHAGSWEAGVNGAMPGIAMPANPTPGMRYRQEYYFNETEDEAEVLETGIQAAIPLGTYNNCLKTREWTDLEPDLNEQKIYAPGIGLIKEINLTDNEQSVLIEIKG